MKEKSIIVDDKKMIKSTIVRYVAAQGRVSRNDIVQNCGYSLPTVLQKLKELVESGLVAETGQTESNGGRRAKLLSMVDEAKCAVGVNITRHHLELVKVGLTGEISAQERCRLIFEPNHEYYQEFSKKIREFIKENVEDEEKMLGVAISVPGILDTEKK